MILKKKFQEGGVMGAPEQAPQGAAAPAGAEMGGQDPMQMIVELFVQGLQAQDCNALAQGAQLFLQLVQSAQGGAAEPEGQPVFAKGGKLIARK